jgi:hypothetical protein
MSIHDFHSQFAAGNESLLFRALRKLSRLEDVQKLMTRNPDGTLLGWGDWSATAANVAR